MKRSSSPDKSENGDKKSKSCHDEEAGSTSQAIASVSDGGGGDIEDTKELRSTGTPSSVGDCTVTDDKTVPTLSESTSDDNGQEKETVEEATGEAMEEVKEEDTTASTTGDGTEQKGKEKWERWQLVPTTTRQRLNYLLTTSKLSDCTILVGKPDAQQEFKLHSVILAMTSPELEDLLSDTREVVIPDVEPDVFKQILEYIYLDYVNLWSVEKTQALYRASVKFKLPHLCEKAVEYMMAKMNLDSIWPIFDAAIATDDQILTEECTKFFKKNINDLLKHPNFPSVDHSVITKLVTDDNLGVPEADLIGGVLKWAHQKCEDSDLVPNLENKRNILRSGTINNLRFLALSKEYFASQVAFSTMRGDESILTLEESYAILMNMVQPNSYPMPEGFSTITKQRTIVELNRLIRRVFNPLGNYQVVNPQSPRLDKLTVLPGPALTAPFGCKSFSLDLIVNKNITLFGIQVPTFFPGMIVSTPKLYEETYIVSIQNASKPNKPMIGSINWSGKVAYNSFVDLQFKENIRLEKNSTYTIMVYTNNMYYLNQKLCTVEESNGVKFTLKDSVTLFGKPGKQDFAFISQIIYSL
ncbi:uncharacterized protein LOC124364976 isoform X1 [Homalodisca vitripennis]|uniref:uncharacterized protein LOC124364976 isoform X1 n=1 Tax=Homalodisca vitripennis TaxID=197043 RepID=UPI001EEA78CF|nr:uncharacterized protein LOC124364976 isoform X1 [Homalodisca vitripennis]